MNKIEKIVWVSFNIIMIILFLFGFIHGIYSLWVNSAKTENYIETKAECIDREFSSEDIAGDQSSTTYYIYTLGYATDDGYKTTKIEDFGINVGDRITIKYNPNDYNDIYLNTHFVREIIALIILPLIILPFVILNVFIIKNKID